MSASSPGIVQLCILLLAAVVQAFTVSPSNPKAVKVDTIKTFSSFPSDTIDSAVPTPSSSTSNGNGTSTTLLLDPLVTRLLLDNDDDDNHQTTTTTTTTTSLVAASHGLGVWRSCLLQGRLATEADFVFVTTLWPPEPLFASLQQALIDLQFPRFVLRHPETVSVVLRSLLRMTIQFSSSTNHNNNGPQPRDDRVDKDEDEDWDYNDDHYYYYNNNDTIMDTTTTTTISEKEQAQQLLLAEEIVAQGLTKQWGGVMSGVQSLDQLFGMDHGLLEVGLVLMEDNDDNNNNNDDNMTGFGWNDGIWQHSGWKYLPALQQEMAAMPELRELIASLGRRPTAHDSSDANHKFVPRRLDNDGALGAQYDPTQRASVQGITLSGSLSEMLPSEALLLVAKQQQQQQQQQEGNDTSTTNMSSPLRRLFFAKMVESKLLSYEASGWQDVPSVPVPKPRYLSRLPSAPGGPILICLDTSWSMTGRREQLSKAVVLACVAAAHKQKRDVEVVAFSSARNVMETGPISATAHGIRRLLEFLSSSFGGGTDVTGALKHAIMMVRSNSTSTMNGGDASNENDGDDVEAKSRTYSRRQETVSSLNSMAAADILLVSDGEIPDPPVSEEIMDALERLKHRAGVQVHGLLVGKRESVPLSKICTHMHDFLVGYEMGLPSATPVPVSSVGSRGVSSPRSMTALRSVAQSLSPILKRRSLFQRYTFRSSTLLQVKNSDYDDDWGGREGRRNRVKGKKKRQESYGDDDMEDYSYPGQVETAGSDDDLKSPTINSKSVDTTEIDRTLEFIKVSVADSIQKEQWEVSSLDSEMQQEQQHCGELHKAIGRISEGLVEREEEARLVVLGMVAQEHVLFLGPPGTAKSVLGRRLSQLCGGVFFQRLFTRFTTPEEIFGPLSLRALENDEYRRKTDGFLPTATVAFLDEIFKANSAILNTLLTILNERQFDNGAGVREMCPIRCVVGASNELPESDELDALYDRFLLRKEVLPVSDEGIMQLLGMPLPGISVCDDEALQKPEACDTVFTDDLDQLIRGLSHAADSVVVDEETCTLMRELRSFMREDMDVDVSDRRLVKATRLLKISAASHGRTKVDPVDCLLLQHVIWRMPEQRAAVREWLWNNLTPGSSGLASSTTILDESLESAASSAVRHFRLLLDGLRDEALQVVRKTSGDVSGESGARQPDLDVIQLISQETGKIGDSLAQRLAELSRHSELLRRSENHLWLDPNEAQAAKQLLLPRAEAYIDSVSRVLNDARSLAMALSPSANNIEDENRLAVIELLWEEDNDQVVSFSADALAMGMKEAKAKYDIDTFRKWKRARKKSAG